METIRDGSKFLKIRTEYKGTPGKLGSTGKTQILCTVHSCGAHIHAADCNHSKSCCLTDSNSQTRNLHPFKLLLQQPAAKSMLNRYNPLEQMRNDERC